MNTAPATRRLPFDVRPHHRETVDSYSTRLLDANFCDASHRADMTRQFQLTRSEGARDEAWMKVLTTRTKRDRLHLDSHQNGWLTHRRNGDCIHFRETLPSRFACTHCTHGKTVQQNPHFDTIVCTRHQRWIGLWGSAADQHHTSTTAVDAQRTFAKLRRKHLLDVRNYLFVVKTLANSLHPGVPLEKAEALVFPTAVALIETITSDDFARRFFDPAARFAASHSYLDSIVTAQTGAAIPAMTQAFWIYLRPTVRSLQDAIATGTPYRTKWDHDYPLRTGTALALGAYSGELEDISHYLAITDDTEISAALQTADLAMLNPSTADDKPKQFTCDDGHTFDYLPPAALPNTMTPTMYTPICGRCTTRRVRPGDNDIQTVNPTAAAQFDSLRNGGLTAADVAANSSTNHIWLCPAGHSHEVSPSKKNLPNYKCPVCSNRTIRAGENCLLTTHPEKAAMWAEGWSERRSPSALSAGSNELADWRCPEGHIFCARPWELTSGKKDCNICARERGIQARTSLVATHPLIARLWHPTLNGSLTPEHVTHGERRKVWWQCDEGHDHHARIDKMTLGQQCSICGSRKLITGVNDLQTVEPILCVEYHPYLNLKAAEEIFPGDQKHWWRCLAAGHNHQQTVQNRKQSKGCPKCKPGDRVLVYSAEALDEPGLAR